MLLYVLICLSLSLTGVAGLQMMYMLYMETVDRQRKKRLSELEHEGRVLRQELVDAELRIAELERPLAASINSREDSYWAEVIDEV